MNPLLKMLISASIATNISILLTILYYSACHILVVYFKYNYGNDNYWVFSHCFVLLIISWIFSFGFFIATIGDN